MTFYIHQNKRRSWFVSIERTWKRWLHIQTLTSLGQDIVDSWQIGPVKVIRIIER